ncbi:MAG: alpha,alpha-phosphotrehalase [Solobacterium sp.]|nr:alpha,alpha-phosphotrehalase [Solobacterium sp.]
MGFRDKVVYQVYPKSFCDSNHDGWGDLKGIISKLDYLEKLGIDYIWINPVFISPQKDNGYDVADYRRIDPRYGTMQDLEELCEAARNHNIDIMLDMVFNHTSTDHEWFQKALAGDEKYRKYYFFRKPSENGGAPNNWQSKFGGSAWQYVDELNEYYLHLFDPGQADLDWTNPDVREECADIVRFWMGKGVRGFRFDVINLISKAGFDDDPNEFDGRQFYTDGPHVHEYLKELNENSFGRDSFCMTVGEMSSTTIDNCIRYSGSESHELTSVFTFHHLKVDYKNQKKWELQPFDFKELKRLLALWQTEMQVKDAWNANFWNNHDQPRALSRFGDDKNYPAESGKMLATVIHMMRGTPYIFEGEEIGMTNAYFTDIRQYKDVESINIYDILKKEGKDEQEILHILNERSRDNARTPMQWDDSPNAGFTDGIPWISVNENYRSVNAEKALKEPDSLFYHYQKLIRLRKQYPVIQSGLFRHILEDHDSVYAFMRTLDDTSLICVNNFYGKETEISLDDIDGYRILISSYKDTEPRNHMILRPYESFVMIRG